MAQLPTMNIPDADVPRLRAALQARLNDNTSTDAQLYKKWVAQALAAEVRAYEGSVAHAQAEAGVAAPPVLS